MKKIKEQIKLEYMDLHIGENRMGVCPFCNASHETSFSVSRIDEGLLYNCFRVKCKSKGFIPSISLPYDERVPKPPKEKEFNYEVINLTERQYKFFKLKYELSKEDIDIAGIKYIPSTERFYIPVFDEYYYTVGINTKLISTGSPKHIIYWKNPKHSLYFPKNYANKMVRCDEMFLVEDQLSAIKLSNVAQCCASLGTSISFKEVDALKRIGIKRLVVFYDPDAKEKMLSIVKKYNLYFRDGVHVVFNDKDPKDTSYNKLAKIINDTRGEGTISSIPIT